MIAENLLPHPGRDDDHRLPVPLQPPLDGIGGFVVQKAVVPSFLLEEHLGGEIGNLREGLGNFQAEFFRFFDGVRASPRACLRQIVNPFFNGIPIPSFDWVFWIGIFYILFTHGLKNL